MDSSSGPFGAIEGFYDGQDSIPCFWLNVGKSNAHAGTKGVLIRLGTDPGNDPFSLDPLRGLFREGELHGEFGADRERCCAFDKETSSADAACPTIVAVSFRRFVAYSKRQIDAGFRARFFGKRGLAIGEDLIDDEIPGEASNRLTVVPEQVHDFS